MSTSGNPVLVACAHGTSSAAGRRAVARLRLDVAAARPGLRVLTANADVDVQRPGLARVLDRLAVDGTPSVVVPLLLSTGYHVEVDVARAAAATSSAGLAVTARAVGPDPVLVEILVERLTACGATGADAVVLAAAGSSRPGARAEVEQVAAWLGDRLDRGPVAVGYAAGSPPLADVVARVRTEHPRSPVAVATYLLAPSSFGARLAGAGADRVAEPLAPHPLLTHLVLARYDEAQYSAHG